MNTVLLFIVVLGILIFFHELGHFLIARLFGVGVEKFSLGFGPRILGKTIGRTDYRISLVPLGGYVKMMGEEPDKELPPEDLPYSFTHKHVAKRAAIVAAGPLFNILLAIIIFIGGLYFAGLPSIKPYVRSVDNGSPAQAAGIRTGDMIRAINGETVTSWRAINAAVEDSGGAPITVSLNRNGSPLTIQVTPTQVGAKDIYGDDITYYNLGIKGYRELSAVVDEVVEGMPAEKSGLQKGDLIIAIDGHPIDRWEAMQDIVSQSNGAPMRFSIQRGEETLDVEITPVEVQEKNALGATQSAYRIGIRRPGLTIPESDQMTVNIGIGSAVAQGLGQTWNVVRETGRFLVKLAERKVPAEAIGGPIRIAQLANQQAQVGLLALLYFIAVISVNLAVINLLPVPVLDGGHLLFFAIEAIQRKPVSLRMRETAQQIGIFLLILLMIFVFYNDITLTWFK